MRPLALIVVGVTLTLGLGRSTAGQGPARIGQERDASRARGDLS